MLAEPEHTHITLNKRAARIQLFRLREHGGTEIKPGDLKIALQVENVFAAPAPDVEQCPVRIRHRSPLLSSRSRLSLMYWEPVDRFFSRTTPP